MTPEAPEEDEMALTLSDSGGGGDFELVSEGTHIARCVRIIDLGMQPGGKEFPEPKKTVMFTFEIAAEMRIVNGEERPTLISRRFTASLHEKATLRKFLETWRGRKFTKEELAGFELRKVLGQPCMLTIVHSDDKKYANIAAAAAMPRGSIAPPQMEASIYYEIEQGRDATYHLLSEKLQSSIDVGAGRVAAPSESKREEPAPTGRHATLRSVSGDTRPMPSFDEEGVPF